MYPHVQTLCGSAAVMLMVCGLAQGAPSTAAQLGSGDYKPSPDRPVGWRGDGTGRFPAADPPTTWQRQRNGNEYASKNIAWMTHLPSGSIASPIVVGDCIFVCSNFADLVCLDKKTGKILWLRPNGYFEAARDADKQDPGFQSKAVPLAEEVRKLTEKLVEQANSVISPNGPTVAQEEALAKLSDQKRDREAKLFDAMNALDPKRYAGKPYQQHCGTSSGTPTSDGQRVYASFLGNAAGPASMPVVCYDLEGRLKWLTMIEGIGAPEHGNHGSMLLVGSRLIFMGNDLTIAFDKDSGKQLWQAKGPGYTDGIAVPRSFKLDGEDALFRAHSQANILRVSDGKVLSTFGNLGWLWSTPMIDGGIAYYGDRSKDILLCAVRMPTRAGEKPKELYKIAAPQGSKFTEVVASPLLFDNLVYSISEGGTLAVADASTGKDVYFAQPFTSNVKWVFNPGTCCSPTLAGGRIYLFGDTGSAIVLQPGRTYKTLATNTLEEKPLGGFNFLSSPWCEAKRLYYRSGNYLYCLGSN